MHSYGMGENFLFPTSLGRCSRLRAATFPSPRGEIAQKAVQTTRQQGISILLYGEHSWQHPKVAISATPTALDNSSLTESYRKGYP